MRCLSFWHIPQLNTRNDHGKGGMYHNIAVVYSKPPYEPAVSCFRLHFDAEKNHAKSLMFDV